MRNSKKEEVPAVDSENEEEEEAEDSGEDWKPEVCKTQLIFPIFPNGFNFVANLK